MQALFCCDSRFKKTDDGRFFSVGFNEQILNRYMSSAQRLNIVIRVIQANKTEIENMSEINLDHKQIIACPNLLSIKGFFLERKNAYDIIERQIRNADIIFIRLPSMIGYIAVDIAKRLNKQYLLEIVGCPWDSFRSYSIRGKLIAPYMKNKLKKCALDAPFVCYVTNKFLQKRYPTGGRNISCSDVDFEDADIDVLKKRINRIRTHTGKYIIGTIAAIDVKYKGQQYIVQALGKLKKEGNINFEYQLVGGGDNTYLLNIAKKYNVSNQIKFLGPLKHDQVFQWLDTIDLYAQPSQTEGMPRALLEAMSRAVPSIGTNVGGIPELLDSRAIFSNTSKHIQIYNMLKNIESEKMIQQAKYNFSEAKKYSKKITDKKRIDFYNQFIESIR